MSDELAQAIVAFTIALIGYATAWLKNRLSERRKAADFEQRLEALEVRAGLHGSRLTAIENDRKAYRNGFNNGRNSSCPP